MCYWNVESTFECNILLEMTNIFVILESFMIVCCSAAPSRPFGLCYEVLTVNTAQKYFLPIIVSNSYYQFKLLSVW
jgi:hypothetical protein